MLDTWTFAAKGLIAPLPYGFATPALMAKQRSNSTWIQEIDENDMISTFLRIEPDGPVDIDYDARVVLELRVGRPASYVYRNPAGSLHVGRRDELIAALTEDYQTLRQSGSHFALRSVIAQFLRQPDLIEEAKIDLNRYRVRQDQKLYESAIKGSIARLTDRGFGFISPEGGLKDIFFHSRELQGIQYDALREGDMVTFEVGNTDRGVVALNVSRM